MHKCRSEKSQLSSDLASSLMLSWLMFLIWVFCFHFGANTVVQLLKQWHLKDEPWDVRKVGCMTPVRLYFFLIMCFCLCVSGPGHMFLCLHVYISSNEPFSVCWLLSFVFASFFPTLSSLSLPIHLVKVRLSANHCITVSKNYKIPSPTNSIAAFSWRYYNWPYFQPSVPLRKQKCCWLFPWPRVEFSRDRHHVSTTSVCMECWCP